MDSDLKDSVILTWQISFEHIKLQRPAAANMLALMGTLNREGIPATMLKGLSADELEFPEDLGMLIHCFLVNSEQECLVLSMHRLVQLTIRAWLSRQGLQAKWEAEALRLVSRAFADAFPPNEKGRDLPKCRALYPHARVVMQYELVHGSLIALQRDLKLSVQSFNKLLPEWLGPANSSAFQERAAATRVQGTGDRLFQLKIF